MTEIINHKLAIKVELDEMEAYIKEKTGLDIHLQEVTIQTIAVKGEEPKRALRFVGNLKEPESITGDEGGK